MVAILAPSFATAQTLSGFRNAVRTPSLPAPAPRQECEKDDDHDHYHYEPFDDCDDDDDDDDDECDRCDNDSELGEAVFVCLTSPFWAPPLILGDDYGEVGEFHSYPYKRDSIGAMMIDAPSGSHVKWWHGRAQAEYAHDLDRLSRITGKVLVDTKHRIGFDSEINWRQEELIGRPSDELWSGDTNVLFRFAQSENVQMRAGIGVNYFTDPIGTETGFNFTYGGDWMPVDPWIVSGEMDWGKLGSATLFHARMTVGIQLHHVEVYTGYDYFDLGHVHSDDIIAGIRLWF